MAQRVEESDAAPAPLRAAGGAGQGGQTEQTLVPLHRPEELTLQLNEVRGDMRTKLAKEHLKWEGATAQTSLETRMPAPERGARGPPVRRHPVSEGRDVSSQYGGMDETCPLCTGGGDETCPRNQVRCGQMRLMTNRHRSQSEMHIPCTRISSTRPVGPVSTGGGTRRVQLVRGEARDVSSQYGREGEGC